MQSISRTAICLKGCGCTARTYHWRGLNARARYFSPVRATTGFSPPDGTASFLAPRRQVTACGCSPCRISILAKHGVGGRTLGGSGATTGVCIAERTAFGLSHGHSPAYHAGRLFSLIIALYAHLQNRRTVLNTLIIYHIHVTTKLHSFYFIEANKVRKTLFQCGL